MRDARIARARDSSLPELLELVERVDVVDVVDVRVGVLLLVGLAEVFGAALAMGAERFGSAETSAADPAGEVAESANFCTGVVVPTLGVNGA